MIGPVLNLDRESRPGHERRAERLKAEFKVPTGIPVRPVCGSAAVSCQETS